MGLLGQIGAGVIGGIATDHARPPIEQGLERVAQQAGDPEREGDLIDGPLPSSLWARHNPHLEELRQIDATQAAIVAALLHERRSELADLIEAIKGIVPAGITLPFWFAAGDLPVSRSFPFLPDGGAWKLDGFTAYTDPAAAADATLQVSVTGMLAIPMRIVAARNNPASVSIGLPITSDAQISITPAAGAGGSAADRVCLLVRFTRNT